MPNEFAGLMAQYANAPLQQRYVFPYMGNLPAYGTLFGTTHLNEAIAPQVPAGSPRPLRPGEYNENPGGGWSSEISITVPHPTKRGKWTNIPSVWLVNGVPKRLTQEQSILAARQSGLTWPEFDTAQNADAAAAQRETDWGALGRADAAAASPLWVTKP
jgi:hypothetical protein